MKYLTLLLLLGLLCQGCESEFAYETPALSDQHITLTIGEEVRTFRHLGADDYGTIGESYLTPARGSAPNRLHLERASADGQTVVILEATGMPLTDSEDTQTWTGNDWAEATITIRSSEMSGSLYCPHTDARNEVSYPIKLHFDRYEKNSRMTGSFTSSADRPSAVTFREGSFDVYVAQRR